MMCFVGLVTVAACQDSEPAWLVACETSSPVQRADTCKTTCGADALCPGADQDDCEAECRACTPDHGWCPVEP